MIKAIALDDEPPALKVIQNFCAQVDFIELTKTFTSAEEAQKHLRKFPVDLIFLDIQMPSITGIDFYKSLEYPVMVIFTTAFSEYAVEGFDLKAIDYLLKPYTPERFKQAVEKAKEYYEFTHKSERTDQRFIFIRADYSLMKINFDDIILIEGLDDYLKIHLQNSKPLVARMTMKAIAEKLPANEFVRVHRSYIVPVQRIARIKNKSIVIQDREIPIGASYEEAILQIINKR